MKATIFLIISVICIGISSCVDKTESETEHEYWPTSIPPLEGYQLIDKQSIPQRGWDVELYMLEKPFVGFNELAIRLLLSGTKTPVKDGWVDRLWPEMRMATSTQGTPYSLLRFKTPEYASFSDISFIKPSSDSAQWFLEVSLMGKDEEYMDRDTAYFDIEVADKNPGRVISYHYPGHQDIEYYAVLKKPEEFSLGMNDISILIYGRSSLTSFGRPSGVEIELAALMPGSGYSSSGNIVLEEEHVGEHSGELNLDKPGIWKISILINSGGGNSFEAGSFLVEVMA